MRITYVGHATLLISVNGTTVLTDPNFDPTLGGMLRRVSAPGVAISALPRLDMILLTHAHADHLSFRSLAAIPQAPLYAPPAVSRWIQRRGVGHAIGLAPGDSVTTAGVTVHAAAATHRGNRYGVDRWRSQANMYLLESSTATVFFAGDTALTPRTTHLVEERLGEHGRRLDVALLPIGHAPWWKHAAFRRGHLTSLDALELFERLGARYLIPYHWGTFNHVTATAHDAIVELRRHVRTHARGTDVRILEPGGTFMLPEPV